LTARGAEQKPGASQYEQRVSHDHLDSGAHDLLTAPDGGEFTGIDAARPTLLERCQFETDAERDSVIERPPCANLSSVQRWPSPEVQRSRMRSPADRPNAPEANRLLRAAHRGAVSLQQFDTADTRGAECAVVLTQRHEQPGRNYRWQST